MGLVAGSGYAEPAGDRLDERGLAGAEIALERDHRARRQRSAERLALGLELGAG